MINDLISRKAAVKLLCDKADGYYVSMFATSYECHTAQIVAMEAANEIESIPAVDAVPVVHGRWINQDSTYTKYQCSACKERNFDGVGRYCPNCGARMDEEE